MTTPTTQPRLRARVVLFDLDDTLLANTGRPGADGADPFVAELIRLMQRTHGLDSDEAATRVNAHLEQQGGHVTTQLQALGLDTEQFVRAMVERLRPSVHPFTDGIDAVRSLYERGYEIYPATTNGHFACRVKLYLAGLVDLAGAGCFRELFGGAELVPEGKTSPTFYRTLLQRIDAAPDEVVMVGDHPENDLALAQRAGIEQVVLPRRDQSQPWVAADDGGIYVRALTWLLDALPPHPG
ncbi:MAG: HAD family hydrolase [Phycisphaeraceae bacterium]